MITTHPKAKPAKKPAPRKPRTIETTDDAKIARENARHDRLITLGMERIKSFGIWPDIEKRVCEPDVDVEQLLRTVLVYMNTERDGVALAANSDGIQVTDTRDDYRVQIYWHQLCDELEEATSKSSTGKSFTSQVKKTGEASAKTVGAAGKRKFDAPGYQPAKCNGKSRLVPPGATGATTPEGIKAHDPDAREGEAPAEPPAGNGSARKRQALRKAGTQEDLRPETSSLKPHTSSLALSPGLLASSEASQSGSVSQADDAGGDRKAIVDQINPNPYQPRREFPAAEIAELAGSIEQSGLAQPIAVRCAVAGGFEIIDGERRWRAFKTLGRDTISVVIRDRVTNQQMAELALEANDQRKDFSAIERARAYRRILDEFKLSHEALAARLPGRSKAYVSNLVRLLDLPEAWQARVAAGELSPSHAELVVPWVKYPSILKAIETAVRRDGPGPLSRFETAVRHATLHGTESITEKVYCRKTYHYVEPPAWTAEQLEKLRVIDVKGWDGKIEKRASNVKAYRAMIAAQAAKQSRGKKAAERDKAKSPKAAKRAAAVATRKANEEFARKLQGFKTAWLAELIDRELARSGENRLLRVVWYMNLDDVGWYSHEAWQESRRMLKLPGREQFGSETPWAQRVAAMPEGNLVPNVRNWLRLHVMVKGKPSGQLGHDEAERFAAVLSIDLAKEWAKASAKRRKAFLELHSLEQLRAYSSNEGLEQLRAYSSNEGGISMNVETKAEMVERLLAAPWAQQQLPNELAPKKQAPSKKS